MEDASTLTPSPEGELAGCIAASSPGQALEAEARLYRLLAPRVRRYGLRHLRDADAASDLMQHVMVLVIERLRSGDVREPQRIVSFVLGACRMTVLEMRSRQARREALLEQHGELLAIADIAVEPRHDHERVAACLERLSERERSVILMSFYEERPAEDVAGTLGLSPGNVRVIRPPRHRAAARLRRRGEERGMSAHLEFDGLLAYWLGETDEASTSAIDEHLLGCDACGAQLDELIALARGVREALAAGLIGAFVAPAFVAALAQRGAKVREYRVPPGASVACGVAPGDDVLVARYPARLEGLQRVDAVVQTSLDAAERRLEDIPFDAASGEVVWLARLALVRTLPAHRIHVRLLAGERVIGRYTLDHSV
ncbi:sigma-70 family RNA polymerase sigma factor [Piscinibacter sp. XHJ-5]|uniref:RNA polymerase sigma factor n=1 Tax=Piscinibacter sp. XHJ-5 TaxID=3037797 RepID=UPI002452F467|nr:sigma-70 family RNA polymerase sigma factor [Piscinibacter sp. XHJ-5]